MSYSPLPRPEPPRKVITMAGRQLLQPCPECGQLVVWPRNDTLLDWPAFPFSPSLGYEWTVVRVKNIPWVRGIRLVAMKGQPSTDGMAHRLHEHQPPESIVRKGRLFPWQRPGTDKTKSSQG